MMMMIIIIIIIIKTQNNGRFGNKNGKKQGYNRPVRK